MTPEQLGYITGLFDGEGYVTITKVAKGKGARSPQYLLYVGVSMTAHAPIQFLHSVFGGCNPDIGRYMKLSINPVYRWGLYSTKAMQFLQKILPLSIVKKEEAKLAIEFQEHKNKGFTCPLLPEMIAYRESVFNKMKELKKIQHV